MMTRKNADSAELKLFNNDAISSEAAVNTGFQDRRARRWLQVAMMLWAALGIAHGTKTLLNPVNHSVYPIFHDAAISWCNGTTIYYFASGEKNEFFYSPSFAFALIPLTALPLSIAALVWTEFSIVFLFFSLQAFYRRIVAGVLSKNYEGQFLSLAVATTIQGSWSAQSNSLVLATVLWGIIYIYERKLWKAAFCLAIPVHVKVWPVIAAALIGIRRPLTVYPKFAVAVLILAALPFALGNVEQATSSFKQWAGKLANREQGNHRYGGYRDSWTIMEHSVGAPSQSQYKILQATSGMLVLAWCVRNLVTFRSERRWLVSTLAWWTIWQLLFGPGTERLTYGIMAPTVAFLILSSSSRSWQSTLAWIGWGLTGILGTGEVEKALLNLVPHAEVITPVGVIIVLTSQIIYDVCKPDTVTSYQESASDVEIPIRLSA